MDDQSFSVVDNLGFHWLYEHLEPRCNMPSLWHCTETTSPQLYKQVSEHIKECLKDVTAVCFTADIWSLDVCLMTLLSLTVTWVETNFTLKGTALQTKPFHGSHAVEAILQELLKECLKNGTFLKTCPCNFVKQWRELIKTMKGLGWPSLAHIGHSLSLVVNEGLLSQHMIGNAQASGWKIVGHFKHSPPAYSQLKESWHEQKGAVCAYAADHDLPATLTANQ